MIIIPQVIDLFFLELYLDAFVQKYNKEKFKNIIIKTWNKISEKGRQEALKINCSTANFEFIKKRLVYNRVSIKYPLTLNTLTKKRGLPIR